MSRIADCTALVLAGGLSRRMGRDKADLVVGGETLLRQIVTAMQAQFDEVIVSVRERRPDTRLQQVLDDPAHPGPLAGLLAGIEAARTPWVFVIACDMPFVTPVVIATLAARRGAAQAIVAQVGGHPQPLAAFYTRSCATPLQALLAGPGPHSLRALLDRLQVDRVPEADLRAVDPTLRSFVDLDTPDDLPR